jgi:citrate lyase beta subunit
MQTSLDANATAGIDAKLHAANRAFAQAHPGESGARQPVHTVYGGAHLFTAGTARKMGDVALRAMQDYAPSPAALARGMTGAGGAAALWEKVYARVIDKLQREPVEDFRIDFEDGYGTRPDAEEDGHAVAAAEEVAKGIRDGGLPPFVGIRIKPFTDPCYARSKRTLDLFVTTLAGKLPDNFVVTIPKVTHVAEIEALCALFEQLEVRTGLAAGSLHYEIMVETPQAVLDPGGRSPLRSFVDAGRGRCRSAHFGTYDYTAGVNVVATHQGMEHPACDFAKHVMSVTLAGTGVQLSDGATNIMPVGPHRGAANDEQRRDNEAAVHRAWRLAYANVRHSLRSGFYQGWDLHPAQLPVRYAAAYSFFLEALGSTTERLRAFVDKAARATLLGDVFDDAATGQGLLNFFLRGLACGAITEDEARATGLAPDDFATRSFVAILERRKQA